MSDVKQDSTKKSDWLPRDEWEAKRNAERKAAGLSPLKSRPKSSARSTADVVAAAVSAALAGARGAGVASASKSKREKREKREDAARDVGRSGKRAKRGLTRADTLAARTFEHNAILYLSTPPTVVPAPLGRPPHFPIVSGVMALSKSFTLAPGQRMALGVNPYVRSQLATAVGAADTMQLFPNTAVHIDSIPVAVGTGASAATLTGYEFNGGGLSALSGASMLGGTWGSFVGGSYAIKLNVPFAGSARVMASMGSKTTWGQPRGLKVTMDDTNQTLAAAGNVRYHSDGTGVMFGTATAETVLGSQGVWRTKMPVPISQEYSWYKPGQQPSAGAVTGDEFGSGTLNDVVEAGQGVVFITNTGTTDAITVDFAGYLCYWANVSGGAAHSGLGVIHTTPNEIVPARRVKPQANGSVNVEDTHSGLKPGQTVEQHHKNVIDGIGSVLKGAGHWLYDHVGDIASGALGFAAGLEAKAAKAITAGPRAALTAAEAGVSVEEVAEIGGMLALLPIGL